MAMSVMALQMWLRRNAHRCLSGDVGMVAIRCCECGVELGGVNKTAYDPEVHEVRVCAHCMSALDEQLGGLYECA
jgi:hypothetical protein